MPHNEWDFIHHAKPWRIRSVELNRWIQGALAWGLLRVAPATRSHGCDDNAPHVSSDNLVRTNKYRLRDVDLQHFRSSQIDGQFEIGRLFDWQIGWLCAFQQPVHKIGRSPVRAS